MRSYDEKRKVQWCLKQKRGIKLEEPNDNLADVYIKKAKSSLNMLDAAIDRDEIDWIVTTAYYARYFALYALFQKCGIKSEIHDCTLTAMKYLFIDEGILDNNLYIDIDDAKEARISIQYYVTETLDKEKLTKKARDAQQFVLLLEEVLENIDEKTKAKIREKLKKIFL